MATTAAYDPVVVHARPALVPKAALSALEPARPVEITQNQVRHSIDPNARREPVSIISSSELDASESDESEEVYYESSDVAMLEPAVRVLELENAKVFKRAGFGPSAPAFKAPRIEPGFEVPYAFTEPPQVQRPAMERGPTAKLFAVGSAITGCRRLTSKKSPAKSTLLWMGERSAAHQSAHQVHRAGASLTMMATRRSTSGMWPIHLPQRVSDPIAILVHLEITNPNRPDQIRQSGYVLLVELFQYLVLPC
jgi:hypothetical protein